MKLISKRLISTVLAVLFSTSVVAGTDLCHGGSCGVITGLSVNSFGSEIIFDNPVASFKCTGADGKAHVLLDRSKVDASTYEHLYSMALAASMSGDKIVRMKAIDEGFPPNQPDTVYLGAAGACSNLGYLEFSK